MANMLQLIFKNLVTKQSTRLYPIEKERDTFERSRGRIVMDPDTCILCGICAKKCPADAIVVERGTGKWELNAYRCIICGECAKVCPKKCITLTNERRHSSEGKLFEGHHVEPPKPIVRPVAPRPTIVPTPVVAPIATPATESTITSTTTSATEAIKTSSPTSTTEATITSTPTSATEATITSTPTSVHEDPPESSNK